MCRFVTVDGGQATMVLVSLARGNEETMSLRASLDGYVVLLIATYSLL